MKLEMKKLAVALAFVSFPVFAGHDAHEHGVGELSITVEGNKVKLDLEAPAESIYFEHEAKTKEDKKIKAAAMKALREEAKKFFIFDEKIACVQKKAKLEEEVHSNGHIDIDAEWRYECQKTVGGSELELTLQTLFPKLKTLRIKINSDIVKESIVSTTQAIKIKL